MAAYEQWYWWYRAERAALLETVRELKLQRSARVLDAGCGTGRNVAELGGELGVRAYGVDLSKHASAFWDSNRFVSRALGSVNELPYADHSFDAVVSVDVLQCEQVDPSTAVCEMARVLRPGGHMVLLVPACQWLLSRHDAAVHCVRRFSRTQLRVMLDETGLSTIRMTHLFPVFFPVLAASRLLTRSRAMQGDSTPRSDLKPLPAWVNYTLLAVATAERHITRYTTAPFGSTILTVARKNPA